MKILIIKIGAIGDVVMTLPVITEIRKQHPNAHITWVCGSLVADLLSNISGIDTIISVNERKIFSANKLEAAQEVIHYQKQVTFKYFDKILVYHPDSRYKVFSMLVKAGKKLYLNRDGNRPALIPGRSRAFEHVRLFLEQDDNFTGFLRFPNDNIEKKLLSAKFHEVLNFEAPLVVFAPGGAKNSLSEQELRRWPVEYYAEVAKYLSSKGVKVAITGIKSDEWVLEAFNGIPILNFVGKLSIIELIALMRQSTITLTHDSGPYHLATFAGNCNVVGLFGPTNPYEFTYGPNFQNVNIFWKGADLHCSPCYYGKYFSTQCKNNVCMQMITVNEVTEHLGGLLNFN